jgi:hypothetical protein
MMDIMVFCRREGDLGDGAEVDGSGISTRPTSVEKDTFRSVSTEVVEEAISLLSPGGW